MSQTISTPTLAQVEGITRRELLAQFLRETGLGAVGTATSGSASNLVDTGRLRSTQFSATEWKGSWVRIAENADSVGNAPEAEISTLEIYDPTTGSLQIDPVLTAAIAVNDSYELWRFPHPTDVLDMLDRMLEQDIYLPCWTLLTEVPDGDMEQNNTTDWTASNATVTKQTSEPLLYGKRFLRVVTTSANGYAASKSMFVEPGKAYHCSAAVRCAASTTAKLLAYDVTNGAEIESKTSTRRYPVRISFEFTAPSGCHEVSIRLVNVENSVTTEWDEVSMFSLEAYDISLPWWVKSSDQVLGVFRSSGWRVANDLEDWVYRGNRTQDYHIQDSSFGRGQLRLIMKGPITQPMFIYGLRNETAYSNDNTDTKLVANHLALAGLKYKVFQHLSQHPNIGTLDLRWTTGQFILWKQEFLQAKSHNIDRIEAVLRGPATWKAMV